MVKITSLKIAIYPFTATVFSEYIFATYNVADYVLTITVPFEYVNAITYMEDSAP